MKKFIFPLLAMASLFMATGCSEKFDVAAPYKNITVVYGLLDQLDTAHYVRIQKAFLDQDKSAVNMAKTADSNFYANLNVRIERYGFTGVYKDSIHLNRVDLNNEGYPKEAGAFFTAPNYAYKFTNLLDPSYIYRIKVINTATGNVDSAEAPVIEDKTSTSFWVYCIDDSSGKKSGIDFAKTGTNDYVDNIFGHYNQISGFNFNGLTSPASFTQAFIRFNWKDSNIVTHQKTPHSYDYNAGYMTLKPNSFEYKIQNLSLYSALFTGIGPAQDANTYRLLDRCDLFIYMGTQDFSTYLATSATQGTGLTGSEIQPVYTNIKGADVLGLFTSRGMHTGRLTITANTIDSLIISTFLAPLKIKGTSYN